MTMRIVQTGRGPLDIADRREELDSWDFERCQTWLQTNDPNGEYDDESCAEYGTTVEDMRDMAWEMMQDA